jgi:hypothetical protein
MVNDVLAIKSIFFKYNGCDVQIAWWMAHVV